MELRIFTEPQQGAGYHRLLALAQVAESLGFGGFFVSDHYLVMGTRDPRVGGTDAFTTLAGLARDTSTIRLGTLVTAATFRLPGPLAIIAAEIDAMSGGRLELGLGAGWYEAEHDAWGIPFPPLGERFEKLGEQLQILTGLWRAAPGERFGFEGRHYRLRDAPAVPRPVQAGGVPIIVGGKGPKRTPSYAARFAAEYNMSFPQLPQFAPQRDVVRAACDAAGRDPDSLVYSAAQVVCVGADEREVERRAAAIGRRPAELRENGVAGTPHEAVEKLRAFAAAGAQRAYLQVLDEDDHDHLRLLAAEVLPHV